MKRFKKIEFAKKNKSSLVKTEMVCIYDSFKVSKETAWKCCRQDKPTRNMIIVSKSRYYGLLENMLAAANSIYAEAGEKE